MIDNEYSESPSILNVIKIVKTCHNKFNTFTI